jgi:hypothetical protein
MIPTPLPERAYTDEELEAAVAAISDLERLRDAQDVVLRTAPSLQRLLDAALSEGGWFGASHDQAVREAAGAEDLADRELALSTLVAEETRLSMLVGVAIGFQLARELDQIGNASRASHP